MKSYKLNTIILLFALLVSISLASNQNANQFNQITPTTATRIGYNGDEESVENEDTMVMSSPTIFSEAPTQNSYTTTGGPRLRDAFRYKFRRGMTALKGTEQNVESRVKEGYGSAKMKMMANGAKFLVDCEVGFETYAYMIKNSNGRNWDPKDIEIIQGAIKAAIMPLKTYQKAEEKVPKRKLGQSVKELFRLLSNKPINYILQDGDWEKGQLHSSVFRRFDIQYLFTNRDKVLSMRQEVTDDLLNLENQKLSQARKYFMKKEDDSWSFQKYIFPDLDWSGFESRYLEIVTKLLVADPDMVKEAKHYLAIYLFTGDSREYHFRSMMEEALRNRDKLIARPTQTLMTSWGPKPTATGATVTVTVKKPAFQFSKCQNGSSTSIKMNHSLLYYLILPLGLFFIIIL
jgi:hypothetical protein